MKITPCEKRRHAAGLIFTRARVSLAPLSLSKNGGLLVVYCRETQHLFQIFCVGSNCSGYTFETNCHPFEPLWLSVPKNCHLFKRFGLSARKKLLSVRAVRVIRSKQYADSGKNWKLRGSEAQGPLAAFCR